jgi:hypothetical protein
MHIWQQIQENFSSGNYGKQPQSDVVEESNVPEVCLLQRLHRKSGISFNFSEGRYLETSLY